MEKFIAIITGIILSIFVLAIPISIVITVITDETKYMAFTYITEVTIGLFVIAICSVFSIFKGILDDEWKNEDDKKNNP